MSQSLFDLSGGKALVTGAARGIGRTLAEGLAAAGADVAVADIDLAPAGEAKAAIEKAGRKCALIHWDCPHRYLERQCPVSVASGPTRETVRPRASTARKRGDQTSSKRGRVGA